MPHEIRITRRLAASADDVYDAWTDPSSVMAWMIPIRGAKTTAHLEPRIGARTGTSASLRAAFESNGCRRNKLQRR